MSKLLTDLDPKFQHLATALIDKAGEAGIAVCIIETLRTAEKHAQDLANGVSWVKRSKHQDGLAIDICPTMYIDIKGWKSDGDLWQRLGRIGKALGMRWGGDWKQKDMGHFEYIGE